MATIKRRIAFIKDLQTELNERISRTDDIVSNYATVDGSPGFNDKYIGANAFKTANDLNVKYTDVVNDLTSGGTTVPLSAEQGKELKSLIDGMANGLEYKGVFDLATETDFSSLDNGSQGDFWKVAGGSLTIGGIDLNTGDMLIVNKDVTGAISAADIDKIDNTESPDILRTEDISTDADFTVDPGDLTTRATIKTFVDEAVASVSYEFINETITFTNDEATLTYAPASGTIFMGYVQISNGDGTIDLVEASVSGTTLTITPETLGEYDTMSGVVSYAYVPVV